MSHTPLLNDHKASWKDILDFGPNIGQKRCQAMSKQSREQCRRQAADGFEVCFIHGGATPRGPANGSYKTGQYSQWAPEWMQAALKAAESRHNRTLRQDIEWQTARILQAIGKLQTGEHGETLWEALQDLARDAQAEDATMPNILPRLQALAAKASTTVAAMREIDQAATLKAQLITAEERRALTAKELAKPEDMAEMLNRATRIFIRHCPTQDARTACAEDLKREMVEMRDLIVGTTANDDAAE